eukprot:599063-Pelagomonas_calceolata.AAC.2
MQDAQPVFNQNPLTMFECEAGNPFLHSSSTEQGSPLPIGSAVYKLTCPVFLSGGWCFMAKTCPEQVLPCAKVLPRAKVLPCAKEGALAISREKNGVVGPIVGRRFQQAIAGQHAAVMPLLLLHDKEPFLL